ncbi:hypothetical protein HY385_01820, partial [Candidatus Daviesbacteria bacterium]|nr:hypothetical protein [Candidatus Daviesbacteria bacterium]
TLIVTEEAAGVVGTKTVKEEGENKNLLEKIIDSVKGFFSKIETVFANLKINQERAVLGVDSFVKLSVSGQFKVIEEMAKSQGVEKSWQYIKDVFKGQAGSSGNIHDLAHLAGSLIYKDQGFSGITICSPQFAFGCYHGFLDEAFKKDLSQLSDAQNACLKLGPENSGPVASCIHGIGHGVASFYSVKDLEQSLSSCNKLTTGREFCFDGVFMEFVRSAPEDFFQKADPLYPCNTLEQQFGPTYSFACGRNQPTLLISRLGYQFADVVSICLNSPSEPFKQACFDSLGFMVASSGDVAQIIASCRQINVPQFVLSCAKAAAGELVFQEVPGWFEKSREVCNSLTTGQNECFQYVERIIRDYGRQRPITFDTIKDGEDIAIYTRNQLMKCYETGGADGCYKKAAALLYNQFGLSKTLATLKENEGYPEVYARCHEVTHYLSRSEFEAQKNIAKVYTQCDSTCHGGCYHGTLEAYLKDETSKKDFDLFSQFPQICGSKNDYQKPLEYNECLHGLGHAAMFINEMELKQSLNLCDTLSEQDFKDRCYTGAFMENSSSSTSNDHASIYIKADDPFYPCNSLEEKYQPLCWQYQSSYFSILTHQDWPKVAEMCLQIPSQYQDNCFRTIGTNQVGFTQSLATMRDDCNLMPNEHFKEVCVIGVMASLSYRFVGDTQKMIEFCSLVDGQQKEACFKQMGLGMLDWHTDKNLAKNNCQQISDPQGSAWCMSVI